MSDLAAAITANVRALYEAHPYPRYPLLATPRWQDGYQAHASFAASLGAGGRPRGAGQVLIGGGGEILPYVIRKWEPQRHAVISVDLSAHSNRRAKWRGFFSSKRTRFVAADLDAYLHGQPPQSFAHIDAYGVIHHMPNPAATLALMTTRLRPGGTLRLMVYNGEARTWIRHLQRLFAAPLLAYDRFDRGDLAAVRRLLAAAAAVAPALAQRLSQLGPSTLGNDARLADTFLHPRETRMNVAAWLAHIDNAGLEGVGLFDRYAELDDLSNPFSDMPSVADLAARAADGRFEHNLELFLRRPGHRDDQPSQPDDQPRRGAPTSTLLLRLKAPPHLWFTYRETAHVSWPMRLRLWHAHLEWVMNGDRSGSATLFDNLPTATLQRLLRIGAVLPGQIGDPGRRSALQAPMATSMTPPQLPQPVSIGGTAVAEMIAARLQSLGKADDRRLAQALARLTAAQVPYKLAQKGGPRGPDRSTNCLRS